jgi:lipoyl-dependent peroxiredoxin
MAEIKRIAETVWTGDSRQGNGRITRYSFATRFDDARSTGLEESLVVTHAAQYSLAFADTLIRNGYQPERIETRAICSIAQLDGRAIGITKMRLETRGRVPGMEPRDFAQTAKDTETRCRASNGMLRGPEIELDAVLF